MRKKIVAIGGGFYGRIKDDGTHDPYETGPMDKEIIRITGKEKPNFLFIAHTQDTEEGQDKYFATMKNIYETKYGCECKQLKSKDIFDKEKVDKLIEWSDIIYEGGGNTLDMIKLWNETGFDRVLINGLFVPHCDEPGIAENVKDLLKTSSEIGLSISNCCALEIIDDEYRLITSNPVAHDIKPYGLKTYWEDGEYITEQIDDSLEFKALSELLSRNGKNKTL